MAYSPDGKAVGVASGGWGVTLFDATSGLALPRLALEDVGAPIAFTPDGNTLIATDSHKALHLRRLRSGKQETIETKVHAATLAISSDGKTIAIGDRGFGCELLRLGAAAPDSIILRHESSLSVAVAISPDGKTIASGGGYWDPSDHSGVRLWDAATGKQVGELKGHSAPVVSLAFVDQGATLVSASLDKTVRFWDIKKRQQTGSINTPLLRMTVSPDKKLLATTDTTDVIRLWSADGGKKVSEFPAGGASLRAIAFSPDGSRIVACGYSRSIRIWETATGKEILPLPGHHHSVVTAAFTSDGKTLVSRDLGTTVRLWDPATGKERRQLTLGPPLSLSGETSAPALAVSPDGTRLAALRQATPFQKDAGLQVWDIGSGEKTAYIINNASPYWGFRSLAFAPDSQTVAGASGAVHLFSATSGKPASRLQSSSPGGAMSVAFSPDGRTTAVGMAVPEGVPSLQLWDWITGTPIHTLPGHKRRIVALSFSPGGHILATCGGKYTNSIVDDEIRLWDVAGGALIRTLKGHEGSVASVALSPDGRLLASAGEDDKTVRLWDVFTGNELAKLVGHAGPVLTVAFSPDGHTVASGSADTTILLWDVRRYKVRPPAVDATPAMLAALWADLRRRDAATAYAALWSLIGAGDKAIALLAKEVRPSRAPDADRLGKWVADLDSNDFAAREAAAAELALLGRFAEPALRKAKEGTASAEVRRRIDDLLDKLTSRTLTDDQLRDGRAVLALEQIGSPSARELLKRLAGGAPRVPLTTDAKAALARLERATPGR